MPLGAFKAALMGTAGVSTGDVVLLSAQTASDSATISFTSDITSTYGEYIFKFYNINPEGSGVNFSFQVNATDSTSYDETMTTTFFKAYHHENDSDAAIAYAAGNDQAQGTAFQDLLQSLGTGADESIAGELHLFNPASTTYVKHFYSRFEGMQDSPTTVDEYAAGYINTTTAIDDIQFKMSSDNFNGKIKMWGVK
jgi:hypothetical protein